MSDSGWPHRRQPTRLPPPWDSPGKNTGVGCHFLLQCMKVKSESEVAQLCPTLSDPMDCGLPGSSIHGIFQARVLEWGAVAFSENWMLVVVKASTVYMTLTCFFKKYLFIYFWFMGSRTQAQYSWCTGLVAHDIWNLPRPRIETVLLSSSMGFN